MVNLVSIPAQEETLEEGYRCPNCGAAMTSGIQDPLGDYDDWLVQPHCSECTFVTWSGKHPFQECVPVEEPDALRAVKFIGRGGNVRMVLTQKDDPSADPGDYWFGGNIWVNAEVYASKDWFEYQPGWTLDGFAEKAHEHFKALGEDGWRFIGHAPN